MAVSRIPISGFGEVTTPSINSPVFTDLTGGWSRLGKTILVELGITVTGTFPANDYFTAITDMPVAHTDSILSAGVQGNQAKAVDAKISTSGKIVIRSFGTALTGERIFISGVYTTT